MNKRTSFLAMVAGAFAFATSANAAILLSADLDASQEVPPSMSTAFGNASLVLNDAQDALSIMVTLTGIDIDGLQTPGDTSDDLTGFHIHNAPAGSNGPVVFGFVGPNSDLDGDLVIDPLAGTIISVWDGAEGNATTLSEQLVALISGGLYFNVHTIGFPPGAIRGQINVVPVPGALILLVTGLAGLVGARRLKPA